MRTKFDEQLTLLNNEMIKMGALCEDAIALSSKALTECDVSLAAKISAIEADIDEKEREIETLCLKLLLQQQPVASDLRQISAALKMITDMERIGDQSKDIGELIRYIDGRSADDTALISRMALATVKMVTDSIDAFVKQNATLAQSVIQSDDTVDELFMVIKQSLILMIREKPENGEYAVDMLMIAKYFERIGDHAVNIAEWVLFSVTGIHKGETEL